MPATIKVSQQRIDSLQFLMCPEDSGQIVEVTYACDDEGLWCKTYDRSDRSVKYEFAPYSARATEAELAFEPQNDCLTIFARGMVH